MKIFTQKFKWNSWDSWQRFFKSSAYANTEDTTFPDKWTSSSGLVPDCGIQYLSTGDTAGLRQQGRKFQLRPN